MAHRADLNNLSPASRQTLVNLMLQYLNDAVIGNHMNIIHSGLELFIGHRAYIAGMEAFLAANGGGQFVPLPMWNPANRIPAEFNVVKPQDDGTPRLALVNLNPSRALPSQFQFPAVCSFRSGGDLGDAINGWHGSVHIAIGGAMADIMISPSAPIFWCWHAYLDHVYWDWQRCVDEARAQESDDSGKVRPEVEPPETDMPMPEMYQRGFEWYQKAYSKYYRQSK